MTGYRAILAGVFLACGCAGESTSPFPVAGGPAVSLAAGEQSHGASAAARRLIDRPDDPGNLDRAIALLEGHLERGPRSAERLILLAEAHSRKAERLDLGKADDRPRHQKQRTEGRRLAEEALQASPNDGIVHYWLAALLLHAADAERSLGRAKEALRHLDRAEELAPAVDQGGPSRLRGKVLQDLPGLFGGSTSRAIASYRRSLAIAPDCITTHLWLGEAYAAQRNVDAARKEFEWVSAAALRPGHEKEDDDDRRRARESLRKLDAP